ncbi:MAG TPA: orotidine-5'-phosphate decarboxylase [Candidatus Paceibacterota bacterium]
MLSIVQDLTQLGGRGMSQITTTNAGLRLWEVQKAQGSGLCIGLDPHFDKNGQLNEAFYAQFAQDKEAQHLRSMFGNVRRAFGVAHVSHEDGGSDLFLAGLTQYMMRIIGAAWAAGIRVYKPQSAFYERLGMFGPLVLAAVCHRLHQLADEENDLFRILDAKRGDIDSTQEPYYAAYLSRFDEYVAPGMGGQFNFDTMTVTTWMGEDVLTPGLPYFKAGKGAIVVTRTSNPSGTTLQDARILSSAIDVSVKQTAFKLTPDRIQEIGEVLGSRSEMFTVHEAMLYETTVFSRGHELDVGGVSPIFSVMGSTVPMSRNFRKLRGTGAIALVPGFGHQGGNFENVEPLLALDGPLAGHWGILSSSRAHNYPWMKGYGGSGNPQNLESDMRRAIDGFRVAERQAYADARVDWPF